MLNSVLVVDDDPIDVRAVRQALLTCDQRLYVHEARNGQEAKQILRDGNWRETDAPRPDLVLLDISMPLMDGVELLRALRVEREVDPIPTVVLSSSNREEEVAECYELGAAGYFHKPHRLDEFRALLRAIHEYWTRCETR